ncbi:beta-glucosidase [Kineococcus xinjiangensis]|uniref:Beta-glucosidase n=1 Tax=Kineococcus xinjiangensis TaxID=512762 RepID=A0A2S6IWW9_9ACTN|nr:glycoside hydrolase family 3 C-terminal domain-containing protein [Kineococcus xinjiangensis]PPK98838.1 beta-glucosidase [Kineococcus xinjiangensis]
MIRRRLAVATAASALVMSPVVLPTAAAAPQPSGDGSYSSGQRADWRSTTTTTTQPWRDRTRSSVQRANDLVAALTQAQRVALVTGDYASLSAFGVPNIIAADTSSGVRNESGGATALPVPEALAATFDVELAQRYGDVAAEEARAQGKTLMLAPTVDVIRSGLSGRQTESLSEDPLLSGRIGAGVSRGMRSNDVLVAAKHFGAYTQETNRNYGNINVSERALKEVYNAPFEELVTKGRADAAMCSYPQVNGVFACENKALMDELRAATGFRGAIIPDFMAGTDNVKGFNAGVDSTILWPYFPRDAFTNGAISATRLEEAAKRVAFAIFNSGVFDNPAPAENDDHVSTATNRAVANRVAEKSSVLLKNSGVLPLRKNVSQRIAVIGPAGADAMTGVGGSSYVIPGTVTSPLAAIRAEAGSGATVTAAQGSLGDVALPVVPSSALRAPDGSAGLRATFYGNGTFSGTPVKTANVATLDHQFHGGEPLTQGLPATWSARFTGKIIPTHSGLVRLSALVGGGVTVKVNGQTVIAGQREFTNFLGMSPVNYPLQGKVQLTAGQPADIEVSYTTQGNGFLPPELHLGWQPKSLIADAVAAARGADAAVVYANQASGEGMDRDTSFALPGDQNELISAVAAANPNTVVVLNTPGGVTMPWLSQVEGVLQVWYPGAAVGTGPANVLFGDADAGGRLPVTFPTGPGQGVVAQGAASYPGTGGTTTYAEGIHTGYRLFHKNGQTPLFPFGHGLSYASFAYSGAQGGTISSTGTAQSVPVTFTVRNTSNRAGTTVAQVYVGALPTIVETPTKALAGFVSLDLAAGESRTVTVQVPRRSLQFWDTATKKWVTPKGRVLASIGTSATDTPLTTPITIS